MNSDEKKKFASISAESTTPPPPASHQRASIGDEPPFAYSSNDRLSLEKGILSVSLLLLMLTDIGNEELDGRIAMGLGIALDRLADMSHGLSSHQDQETEKRRHAS
jgi:Ribbon-helix-helix protein, copG family